VDREGFPAAPNLVRPVGDGLGCGLLPKIRAERELAAFKKFRVEMEEEEWEKEMVKPKSRVHSPLPKPRTNPSLTPTTSNRMRRFQQPGG